jgi:small-conductance mechanosensitive channel
MLQDWVFLGNTAVDYLTAAGIALGGFLAAYMLRAVLLVRLRAWTRRPDTPVDAGLYEQTEAGLMPFLLILALYFGATSLEMPQEVYRIVDLTALFLLTLAGARVVVRTANLVLDTNVRRKHPESSEDQLPKAHKALTPFVSITIWILAALFFLDNLGFQVSALIAGLGIAGVAIGFAAQALLGDLFSYVAILFDRPFEVGDFIITGDYLGTIEKVGIKTTRLRSLGGEQLIFSNSDLTASRLRNYKRMHERRIVFGFGLLYDTPAQTLEKVSGLVRGIIEADSRARFDRAHFKAFGASSLDFEVVYYVLSAEYNVYMDVQESINLALKQGIEDMGAGFAFPTRTLHLASTPGDAAQAVD